MTETPSAEGAEQIPAWISGLGIVDRSTSIEKARASGQQLQDAAPPATTTLHWRVEGNRVAFTYTAAQSGMVATTKNGIIKKLDNDYIY